MENFDAKKARELANDTSATECMEILEKIKKEAQSDEGGFEINHYDGFEMSRTEEFLIDRGFKVERIDDSSTDLGYYHKISW